MARSKKVKLRVVSSEDHMTNIYRLTYRGFVLPWVFQVLILAKLEQSGHKLVYCLLLLLFCLTKLIFLKWNEC